MFYLAGNFSLILALLLTAFAVFSFNSKRRLQDFLNIAIFSNITICFFSLILAYIFSDFSILNVYQNSFSQKPLIYKITASWGNHEGSLLFFTFLLSLFSFLHKRIKVTSYFMLFNYLIILIFLLFIFFLSNPFSYNEALVSEGTGFNPILQDFALAIHPPILYSGYIFCILIYSSILALLYAGEFTKESLKAIRPLVNLSFSFLTCGLALGSWWAYRELGWGGYWFWDPVENLALLVWLLNLGFLHSYHNFIKSDNAKNWLIFFALANFLMILLSFFLVRSGVLVSVHSFSSDPYRGIFLFVIFLFFSIFTAFACFKRSNSSLERQSNLHSNFSSSNSPLEGESKLHRSFGGGALLAKLRNILLLAKYPLPKSKILTSPQGGGYNEDKSKFLTSPQGGAYNRDKNTIIFSREWFLTVNNFLLLAIFIIVLWGVLFPILQNYFFPFKKIFLGSPFFNKALLPILLILLSLMLIVPFSKWKNKISIRLSFTLFLSVIFLILVEKNNLIATLLGFFSLNILLQSLIIIWQKKVKNYSMLISHCGFALMIFAISLNNIYKIEKEELIGTEQILQIENFSLTLNGFSEGTKDNYHFLKADINLNDGKKIISFSPMRRYYIASHQTTKESSIKNYKILHNLYIVVGEIFPNKKIKIRFIYSPFINLLWFSVFLMIFPIFSSIYKRIIKYV